MNVTQEQLDVLKQYIGNIAEIVSAGDVQRVLDEIDNVIVDNILAHNDEPDEEGIKLQRIYDHIYNQN